MVISKPNIQRFFKDFTIHRMKTNKVVVLSSRPLPNILKYRDYRWDHWTIWKIRFLQKHLEEFSWYVWKFPDWFKTTTGRQSWSGVYDKSRLVMLETHCKTNARVKRKKKAKRTRLWESKLEIWVRKLMKGCLRWKNNNIVHQVLSVLPE